METFIRVRHSFSMFLFQICICIEHDRGAWSLICYEIHSLHPSGHLNISPVLVLLMELLNKSALTHWWLPLIHSTQPALHSPAWINLNINRIVGNTFICEIFSVLLKYFCCQIFCINIRVTMSNELVPQSFMMANQSAVLRFYDGRLSCDWLITTSPSCLVSSDQSSVLTRSRPQQTKHRKY